jgi:predicted dehydrogenase
MNDPKIDAVMIATPVTTHFEIAKQALKRGKHVLVEKPIAASSREAHQLIELAQRKRKTLLVDHTFVYTPAVRKIKEIVASERLGSIFYFDSVRINLGLFQHDINVVWDLAPHDLSIMHYVLGKMPRSVVATGASHSNNHKENTAYISMELENNALAHIHVNWLSPVKIRRTIVGGSRRMLVFDDLESDEKLRIYDRGFHTVDGSKEGVYKTLVKYRVGDMHSPYVEKQEALKVEIEHFIDCLVKGKKPITDGEEGLKVVRVLEAIDKSLEQGGKRVRL